MENMTVAQVKERLDYHMLAVVLADKLRDHDDDDVVSIKTQGLPLPLVMAAVLEILLELVAEENLVTAYPLEGFEFSCADDCVCVTIPWLPRKK